MDSLFWQLFKKDKPIIAMLHIFFGSIDDQINRALKDLKALKPYVDGVIVENYVWGYLDSNFAREETEGTLTEITNRVVKESIIPVGVNVLPNDYAKAFEICYNAGAKFIQLDHITGDFVSCESVDPIRFMEARYSYPEIMVLGGIHPKCYELKNPDVSISKSAAAAELLCDAVVVTGECTGGEAALSDLQEVKSTLPGHPVIVGSGLNAGNAKEQLAIADGAIVGTFLKKNHELTRPVDVNLVKELMGVVQKLR